MAGPAGAEGRHQGGGADLRDAEETFEVAAGEQFAVERFELADGVGDGEQWTSNSAGVSASMRLRNFFELESTDGGDAVRR